MIKRATLPNLSRRMTLRGALTSLALPFLPSALPRGARADSSAPKRMLFWYVPNGIQYRADQLDPTSFDSWKPEIVGPDWDLKPITQPLEGVRSKVNVITGLQNEIPYDDPVDGDHARGTGTYLTCTKIKFTGGDDIENGISVDQYAAAASTTPFASLQLGTEPGGNTGSCNAGYSCAYLRNLAWAEGNAPLPNVVDPLVAFTLLFPNSSSQLPAAEVARRTRLETSALDYVTQEATLLSYRINAEDKAKLDQYLTAVREVELRLASTGSNCGDPELPAAGADLTANVQLMCDLQVLALQCDITRLITFMLANSTSSRSFDFLGIPGGHHELSHHQNNVDTIAQLQTIATWEVEQYAYLLGRLDGVVESNGMTLLDNSLAYFSSEIQDGDQHTHTDLPILLAGSCGGATVTGRHLKYRNKEPLANLFTAMMEAFGSPIDNFGNATGILPNILAD